MLAGRREQARLEARVAGDRGHAGLGQVVAQQVLREGHDARVVVGDALGDRAVLGLALQAHAAHRVGRALDAELGQVDRQVRRDRARLGGAVERGGQPREHADGDVVGLLGLEGRALARRVGVMGVAGGLELRAARARLVVLGVQAQRAAQEGQRRDDLARAARRGLPQQHARVGEAGVGQAALGGDEQLAVDARRERRLVRRVLRQQELRLVGLVPDAPGVDLRAVVAARRRATNFWNSAGLGRVSVSRAPLVAQRGTGPETVSSRFQPRALMPSTTAS